MSEINIEGLEEPSFRLSTLGQIGFILFLAIKILLFLFDYDLVYNLIVSKPAFESYIVFIALFIYTAYRILWKLTLYYRMIKAILKEKSKEQEA